MIAQEHAEQVQRTARELVKAMHLDLQIEVSAVQDGILVDVQGKDKGFLLQKNAEALYALDYILNRIFGREHDESNKILVDCEKFRSMREDELRFLAQKAYEKVLRYGQPVNLQPMPANERRIIHLALADQPKVKTRSEGVGEFRKITIFPE